ncbi:MAG TPA: methyltransferase domain-containing protein [Candidatus Nanoarchaeia archaeon]|nr:methyltransferase domain-containing protein [Candidatus Nanoarchaeia archaeon]
MIISTGDISKILSSKTGKASISPDIGMTSAEASVEGGSVIIRDQKIPLSDLKKIRDDKSCYIVEDGKLHKVQFFSEKTGYVYKLIPTSYRPILKISGTSMHKKEFVGMIERSKLKGKVLDSGTGLGYTAIAASRTAGSVITIEHDENVIEIARLNPYSSDIFNKKNIRLINADVVDEMKSFKASEFDSIILDGGIPTLSGKFFSLENYSNVYRVLKRNGRLYHYIPSPEVTHGRNFQSEVVSRLKNAGFSRIKRFDSYVIATK